MNRLKTFSEYMLEQQVQVVDEDLDFYKKYSSLDTLNESTTVYQEDVASVFEKVHYYNNRANKIYRSNINESLKEKMIREQNLKFNESEKIGVEIIFSEMLRHYEESLNEEIEYYDRVINGDIDAISEAVYFAFGDQYENLLEEGIFKKMTDKVVGGAKAVGNFLKDTGTSIAHKTTEIISKTKEFARKLKGEALEKFKNLVKFVKEIISVASKDIKNFIQAVIDTLEKFAEACGGMIINVIQKLGGCNDDDKEMSVKVAEKDGMDVFKNFKTKGEKSYVSYVMNSTLSSWNDYATEHSEFKETMIKESNDTAELEKDIDAVEGDESKFDKLKEKVLGFVKGLKEQAKTWSFWKTVLIAIGTMVFMMILPGLLGAFIGPAGPFICALISWGMSLAGFIKLIKGRMKQMKDQGKSGVKAFFDKKTTVMLALSIVCLFLSTKNVYNTFKPFSTQLCSLFHLDSNSEGWAKKLVEWSQANDPEGWTKMTQKTTESITQVGEGNGHSVISQTTDFNKQVDAAGEAFKNAGWSAEQVEKGQNIISDTLKDLQNNVIKSSKSFEDIMHQKFAEAGLPEVSFVNQNTLNNVSINNSQFSSMMNWAHDTGASVVAVGKSNLGLEMVIGGDTSAFPTIAKGSTSAGNWMELTTIGSNTTNVVKEITTNVAKHWSDLSYSKALFAPTIFPFFDTSLDGKFKMRFSSATRGYPAYVVSTKKSEHIDGNKLKSLSEGAPGVDKLIQIHNNAWEESKQLLEEENEGKKKKKQTKIVEPEYVVIYVNKNEDTGNEKDAENGKERDKKPKDEDIVPGIVIDPLTMMCADICPFNKSRRKEPYFMKGLFSRLSFRPTASKDNTTKGEIHTLLGTTMKNCVIQCTKFGLGQKYVYQLDKDRKDSSFVAKQDVDKNKESSEIGNFTPQELCECLNDKSKNNAESYHMLGGAFASKASVSVDKNGKTKITVKKDDSAIEFVKYYKISNKEQKRIMDEWEEKVKKAKAEGKKKPTKPFKTVTIDGKEIAYMKLTKKAQKEKKIKDSDIYDFVDIKIVPLLSDEKSKVYEELNKDENIKKILYPNGKLEKGVIDLVKPFLFRPETTFSKSDDYALESIINKEEKKDDSFWQKIKKALKSEKKIYDVFKDIVEIIWDELSDGRRSVYGKRVDNRKSTEPIGEGYYTLFDQLVEEYLEDVDVYEDEENDFYTNLILEMRSVEDSRVMSREEFLSRYC